MAYMHGQQVTSSQPSSTNSTATHSTALANLQPASPSTANKPIAPMPTSTAVPPISLNKTWILPPKPKPGRKPAVDTPPTKRKAQNREAQRAFRERRAAKVGELEEEMKKMEEEDAREQDALRQQVQQLESSVGEYASMVVMLRERFNEMQMAYGKERQLREQVEAELQSVKRAIIGGTEAVVLPPRRTNHDRNLEEPPDTVQDDNEHNNTDEIPLTCGNCSVDTRCACIEQAFEVGNLEDDSVTPTIKRPHSPPLSTDNKRPRYDDHLENDQEIDFTAQFSSKQPPALTTSASTSSSIAAIAPPDPCGFCQDGSPCICVELAKDKSRHARKQPQAMLPPNSEFEGRQIPVSDPCANGPGTCAQCRSNPTSTLFCKTVAANRSAAVTNKLQVNGNQSKDGSSDNMTITCADAFTTLSRHPGFSAATNELNTWVPQLRTATRPSSVPERTAFDIEAASVMSVLKLFDRRFGDREGGPNPKEYSQTFDPKDSPSMYADVKPETSIVYEDQKMEASSKGSNDG